MLERILALYENENDAITHGMVGSSKIIERLEDLSDLVDGCPCCLIIEEFDDDTFLFADYCAKNIYSIIGNKGIYRLCVNKKAFDNLTQAQKNNLVLDCTKYLIFVRAVGKYSIYRVCNNLDCSKPTYAVYCGGSLEIGELSEDEAILYIKSKLGEEEKSGKTIDDAVKEVAPPKPEGPKL